MPWTVLSTGSPFNPCVTARPTPEQFVFADSVHRKLLKLRYKGPEQARAHFENVAFSLYRAAYKRLRMVCFAP